MPTNEPTFVTTEDIQYFADQELPEKATYQDLLNLGGTYLSTVGKVAVPTPVQASRVCLSREKRHTLTPNGPGCCDRATPLNATDPFLQRWNQ